MIALPEKKVRMPKVVQITSAVHTSRCRLEISFSDGHVNEVDFEPFLKRSPHPAIRAYLDAKKFRQFTIEDGMLHWNDFDLVFPMADLYAGRIG